MSPISMCGKSSQVIQMRSIDQQTNRKHGPPWGLHRLGFSCCCWSISTCFFLPQVIGQAFGTHTSGLQVDIFHLYRTLRHRGRPPPTHTFFFPSTPQHLAGLNLIDYFVCFLFCYLFLMHIAILLCLILTYFRILKKMHLSLKYLDSIVVHHVEPQVITHHHPMLEGQLKSQLLHF